MNQGNEPQNQKEQATKQAWEEPKLAFVEPILTKQGALQEITAGFFGSFTPGGAVEPFDEVFTLEFHRTDTVCGMTDDKGKAEVQSDPKRWTVLNLWRLHLGTDLSPFAQQDENLVRTTGSHNVFV